MSVANTFTSPYAFWRVQELIYLYFNTVFNSGLSSSDNMASSDRMYKELERMWWGTVSGPSLKGSRKVIKCVVDLAGFQYENAYAAGMLNHSVALVLNTKAASVFGELGVRILHTVLFHLRCFRQYSLRA